ncbi:MAG: dicarboxylate transporter/tellurite-resistance protein TehA [Paludibacterium sp.]|uniref:dicarboxylate transporter/tellurite-resistance protein TehA n=1 Tax=Paludibacterium sp. TaxID=1917523 RepID=UPI0025D795AF|nr:dicarboxylate transporter/tellurite-resistance protein TehA [Paludibacterium sp.]MBV8049484.1 dicarboxylate transporter/tellurite-resistance protein TehA [Paludibacterium sp.]MBV8646256.1 dicarboxylate transporter/tellurite-resistance protein TehA [Paludibacterium sp.]
MKPVVSTSISASYFGMVLGLCGLGQAWRIAVKLWGAPPQAGEGVLLLAALIWAGLLLAYLAQAWRQPDVVRREFAHPVQGSTPALLAVSTLLVSLAALPYSRALAWGLAAAGLAWHLMFALWHTGRSWQGGRETRDTTPSLYLPTVAGNFTSAAALGGLGHPDWGWLFLGAGVFSWLAIESLIFQRLWQPSGLPAAQRPLIGIQFAPPVVCAMAWLMLVPGSTDHWLLMLWGYGLFQLLLGLRLHHWLGEQPFAASYWAYTFGVAATTVSGLKLALAGIPAARILSVPLFAGANLFIGWLLMRTLARTVRRGWAHRFVVCPWQ